MPKKSKQERLFLATELLFDGWDYAIPDEYDDIHQARWRQLRAEAEQFLLEQQERKPQQ